MSALKDYFLSDKNHAWKITQGTEITVRGELKVPVQMFLDFSSGSIYLAYYVETVADPLQCCIDLVTGNAISLVLGVAGGFSFVGGFPETNPIAASDLKFLWACVYLL